MCFTSFGIDPVSTWYAQQTKACYELFKKFGTGSFTKKNDLEEV